MMAFLQNNLATILIGAGIFFTVGLILFFQVKNRKKNKADGCGGSCDHCSSACYCQKH